MQNNRLKSILTKVGCVALSFAMITLLSGPLSANAAEIQSESSVQESVAEESVPESAAEDKDVISATEPEEGNGEDSVENTEEDTKVEVSVSTESTGSEDSLTDQESAGDTESESDEETDPADTPSAEPKNGVIIEDGVYHYYINDVMQKWLITTDTGDRYYAGSDGKLARNEVIRFNDSKIGWLYFGDNGKAQKWLIKTKNGDRYYAGSDGKLVRNEVIRFNDSKIGWLYFGDNGKAQKWLIKTKNGDRYYAGSDGKLVRNDVVRFNDSKIGWLYFGDNGKAQKWLINAKNGDRYYAGSDGKLVRNEVIRFSDSKIGWLYFGDNGKAAKGRIVTIDGKYYYATRGDGSIMRTSGRIFLNGNMYYAQDGGILLTNAWKKISGKWYHFNASGVNDKTSSNPPLDAMGEKAQKYSSNTGYLILVDRDAHRVSIYSGGIWNWKQVKTFSCGNGKSSTPTIAGSFSIPSKYPRSHPYFDSGSARCWYPTRIYGGYLFHSVLYYQQSGPYTVMDGRLGVGVSHGCIRLALDNAKWIYYNIPIGTKVVIY